ncbi:PEP/pyruvate-binding domain-containing protein [Patescibacteria group bacterium]
MIRCQILLTPELVQKIKLRAKQQSLSQSGVVRSLLVQAFRTKQGSASRQGSDSEYLFDLSNFRIKNPRINGFKEIFSIGGRTTEIKIVGDKAFRYYLRRKSLPAKLESRIKKLAGEIKVFSEAKTLVVRRAYVVPGLESPPGPRFLGLKPGQVVEALKKVYDFAIEHEYYLPKDSQICAFFYPFADPKPLSLPIPVTAQLPYGGYAVPLNKKASRVEIFSVWGNNEGVQSFDAIDRYVVDTTREIIVEKDNPQKDLMLCTTKRSQTDKIAVPLNKQFEQILSDQEILEVGKVVRRLTRKYGLRRVEFSFDGRDSIIFIESVPYEIYEKKVKDISKRGFIRNVSSVKDVESLRNLAGADISKTIIYIDKSIVQKRAYDVLNSVAGLPQKFTVFYPGLSATAHAMRVLNDFGHTAIVVGNRVFKEGEEVIVKVKDGQISTNLVSKNSVRNFIINLYDARLYGKEVVGGKANNLSLLKSSGFNVPHGSVLTANFSSRLISNCLGKGKLALLKKNLTRPNDFIKELSVCNFDIPKSFWQKIIKVADLSSQKRYAVRSSANVEDHINHSFAGQFKTFLNIKPSLLRLYVAKVVKSAFDPHVGKYLQALGRPCFIKMAVVIQEMIDAQKSGVVFCKDVQTGDRDLIVIDVARGLAEGVVEGTAKTQRIVYSRSKNTIVDDNRGQAEKILSRIEADSLVEMALSVENLMNEPQDIEWAIDKKGGIWVIQTRSLN